MSDKLDDKTRTELEAAVYRRLVEHLRARTDVQNIDMMNLAGFCRNCLSNWMKEAADAKGLAMSKDESREIVYGMPYDEWRKKHQKEATPEQKAVLEKLAPEQVTSPELAGEKIVSVLTRAPGNDAAIGGLKVVTANGWFAARPSGTENIYKLYAESFKSADHLQAIVDEAQQIVSRSLAG